MRHNAFVSPAVLTDTLNIIGVGATGSFIAMSAARMGYTKFRIWDPDIVEAHNLPNQAYLARHVGKLKVEALSELLKEFNSDIEVQANAIYFTASEFGHLIDGPIVLTVDTMKARKEITTCFYTNPLIEHVFESRLGFDHAQVNIVDCLDPKSIAEWESTLLSDEEVPEGPCGLQICTTTVGIVANYIVHQLCSRAANFSKKENWEFHPKTIFAIGKGLSVYP
jgi:hypothetical protein